MPNEAHKHEHQCNNDNHDHDHQESHFSILAQYTKDFSFENPNAPKAILSLNEKPNIEIDLNIEVEKLENLTPEKNLPGELFEVKLSIKTSAKEASSNSILFHTEIEYAGVFLLSNIAQEHVRPLLFIEAPRLLFPFARQILNDATRNGGYQPMLLDPIDFASLYHNKFVNQEAKK